MCGTVALKRNPWEELFFIFHDVFVGSFTQDNCTSFSIYFSKQHFSMSLKIMVEPPQLECSTSFIGVGNQVWNHMQKAFIQMMNNVRSPCLNLNSWEMNSLCQMVRNDAFSCKVRYPLVATGGWCVVSTAASTTKGKKTFYSSDKSGVEGCWQFWPQGHTFVWVFQYWVFVYWMLKRSREMGIRAEKNWNERSSRWWWCV